MSSGVFKGSDLVKVKRTCCAEVPAGLGFSIGDRVHLNSGSPNLTVVDITSTHATVCWRAGKDTVEETYPLPCLHKSI